MNANSNLLIPESEKISSIYSDKIEKRFTKLCFALIILVTMTPIIFCDLYFGFTDLSCSREKPDELAISLKLYLIVSGFVGLSAMTAIFIGIVCFDFDVIYANNLLIMSGVSCRLTYLDSFSFAVYILLVVVFWEYFNLVWNILGAVAFWEYIYGNGNCHKNFSTYVFVSLIIKFISISIGYHFKKKIIIKIKN